MNGVLHEGSVGVGLQTKEKLSAMWSNGKSTLFVFRFLWNLTTFGIQTERFNLNKKNIIRNVVTVFNFLPPVRLLFYFISSLAYKMTKLRNGKLIKNLPPERANEASNAKEVKF